MALRISTKGVEATLKAANGRLAQRARLISTRNASTTSLPEDARNRIKVRYYRLENVQAISCTVANQMALQRDASLPNPDPPADSATASLVNGHTPYMVKTYVRPPPMFVRGEGSYLWDVENRKYLDFTAGIAVNGLGHCDPEMHRIISDQVICH